MHATFARATCHPRSSTLRAHADGSIVITLPPGLTMKIYRLKASEAGSIVSTKAFCLATTNLLAPTNLDNLNYHHAASCDQKIRLKNRRQRALSAYTILVTRLPAYVLLRTDTGLFMFFSSFSPNTSSIITDEHLSLLASNT